MKRRPFSWRRKRHWPFHGYIWPAQTLGRGPIGRGWQNKLVESGTIGHIFGVSIIASPRL